MLCFHKIARNRYLTNTCSVFIANRSCWLWCVLNGTPQCFGITIALLEVYDARHHWWRLGKLNFVGHPRRFVIASIWRPPVIAFAALTHWTLSRNRVHESESLRYTRLVFLFGLARRKYDLGSCLFGWAYFNGEDALITGLRVTVTQLENRYPRRLTISHNTTAFNRLR